MIGTVIGLILLCVILGVVWWAAQQLLALITLAEPFATIVSYSAGRSHGHHRDLRHHRSPWPCRHSCADGARWYWPSMTKRREYEATNAGLFRGFVALCIAAVLLVIIWMLAQ